MSENGNEPNRRARRPLHRLLSWQLRLLPLAIVGLALLLVAGILLGGIGPLRALSAAVLAGVPLGLILSRVQRVHWSAETQRLTATVDVVGIALLLVFWLLLALRTRWLVGASDSLIEAAAIAMATATGILITRLWSLERGIRRILTMLEDERGDEGGGPRSTPGAEGRPSRGRTR